MLDTSDSVRRFQCESCDRRFEATISPMGCPDCGGRLRDLGLVTR